MAESTLFRCDQCDFSINSWSDGNPYYLDEKGKKKYAYHPDHANLARCIGNDEEHLCLDCGHEFKVDSRKPRETCTKCRSKNILSTHELEGKTCPKCKAGTLRIDPDGCCIS